MNRDTAIKISSDGIRELLFLQLKTNDSKLKDYNSFLALLTDIRQLFEAEDYIKDNLK